MQSGNPLHRQRGSVPEQASNQWRARLLIYTSFWDCLALFSSSPAAQTGDESAKELQRKNQQVGLILQTASSLLSEDSASKATDVTAAVAPSQNAN